jgi:hypothetical protein
MAEQASLPDGIHDPMSAMRRIVCARAGLAALIALLGVAPIGWAAAETPIVEGPITGGKGAPVLASTTFDLAQVGYAQEEFFISGTALGYTNVGPLGSDGRWTATPAVSAAYRTRIVVYRPADPRRFKGTVVVEWLNVTGGSDAAPDWINAHVEMIRDGFAWVGVSAQIVGIEGGGPIVGGFGLKLADPERYGSLVHPGDTFSYDIFSQAGQVLRHPTGLDPLRGLERRALIAIGESQSAFRLVTYIDAVHPLVDVFDGFLVHSRSGGASPLSQAPQPEVDVGSLAPIRTDLRVPVLVFQTETDLTLLNYFPDRQPDSRWFRLWEVSGTAHADTYTVAVGAGDLGTSPDAAAILVTAAPLPDFQCGRPINSGQQHFVLHAAVHALDRWVRHGPAPRSAPRIAIAGSPPVITRDAYGNAQGGIRTPAVDAPIAGFSGLGQTGSAFCFLFGTTTPLDATTLAGLYPDHAAYVAAVAKATRRALRARFIRRPDASLIDAAAAASDIGS